MTRNIRNIRDPSTVYFNEEESLAYIVNLLIFESPRITRRCIQGLDFFYASFRNQGGILENNSIKSCDVIAMTYIQIKYPFIVDFFRRTVGFFSEKNLLDPYLIKEKFKDENMDIIDWITEVTDEKITDSKEREDIKKLIGIVAYQYLRIETPETGNTLYYYQRTSEWITLRNYLSYITDDIQSSLRRFFPIYDRHKKDAYPLNELSNIDLLEYSRFFLDIDGGKFSQHLEMAQEIFLGIIGRKRSAIELSPRNTGETLRNTAAYQIIFHLLSAFDKSHDNTESYSRTFILFKNVLGSQRIETAFKYTILNAFVNDQRGQGAQIHNQLFNAFNRLNERFELDIKRIIKKVIDEADHRYFKGTDILYEKEENFFYVLYQSWSGNPDDVREIRKIRQAACRGLQKWPDAIRRYWDRYPFEKEWKTWDDMFKSHRFSGFSRNYELLMPLDRLIKISDQDIQRFDQDLALKIQFWKNVLKNSRDEYNKSFKITEDPATLKAALMRRGFVEKK